jgi:hypothetical protein
MSDERKISERYRSLSREEPPRHLDEAILAAARRAANTRPAPLVVPSGRQRWYFPLGAAAIIVLAVAVTMHVEREQPDPEAQVAAPARSPQPAATEPAAPAQAQEQVFVPDPKPAPAKKKAADERGGSRELRAQRDNAALSELEKAQTPPPPPAAAPAPPQDAIGRAGESARADVAARAAQARREAPPPSNTAVNSVVAPPDQVLQGIADLRRQGRHDEADKALAEFRKRFPDYKISAEMLEKVEKR